MPHPPPKTFREATEMAAQFHRERNARRAAAAAFVATAMRAANAGPRGMGVRTIYAKNANGTHALDPVSLNRIPKRRAVRVGKKVFDAATITRLLSRDPRALNPLTREYFPGSVYRKFGMRRVSGPPPAAEVQGVVAASEELARLFFEWDHDVKPIASIMDIPEDKVEAIEARHGVFIVYEFAHRNGHQTFEATVLSNQRHVAGVVWHYYPYPHTTVNVQVRDSAGTVWHDKTLRAQRVHMSAPKRRRM